MPQGWCGCEHRIFLASSAAAGTATTRTGILSTAAAAAAGWHRLGTPPVGRRPSHGLAWRRPSSPARSTHDVLAAEQLLGQHAGQAAQHVAAAVDHDGLQGRGAGASGAGVDGTRRGAQGALPPARCQAGPGCCRPAEARSPLPAAPGGMLGRRVCRSRAAGAAADHAGRPSPHLRHFCSRLDLHTPVQEEAGAGGRPGLPAGAMLLSMLAHALSQNSVRALPGCSGARRSSIATRNTNVAF